MSYAFLKTNHGPHEHTCICGAKQGPCTIADVGGECNWPLEVQGCPECYDPANYEESTTEEPPRAVDREVDVSYFDYYIRFACSCGAEIIITDTSADLTTCKCGRRYELTMLFEVREVPRGD